MVSKIRPLKPNCAYENIFLPENIYHLFGEACLSLGLQAFGSPGPIRLAGNQSDSAHCRAKQTATWVRDQNHNRG